MIIIPANTLSSGGYDVANSVRFNPGDSAYIHKTPSVGDRQKATFSCWIKRSLIGSAQTLFWAGSDNSNYQTFPRLLASDKLVVGEINSASTTWEIVTDRVFRDTSAWYHIVVAMDTTQATAANRIKIYVNGVQETSLDTSGGYPAENRNTLINTGVPHQLAHDYVAQYYGGYVAEACFIEGSQNAPTDFGEFDEDSGIWKPIDVSGLTFGTNGFYLDFEDSSNLGNDANGGTDLTEVNLAATDQSTDTCTNNFATWNNLLGIQIPDSFSEGNLKVARTSGSWTATFSTIAASSGKFYAEVKWVQGSEFTTGFGNAQSYASDHDLNDLVSDPGGGGYLSVIYKNGVLYENGSNTGTGYSTYSSGDIIMLAMDLDNYKLYLGVGGTWGNSGDPAGNSNGVAIPSAYQGDFFHFAVNVHSSGTTTASGNFGSPEFSISSGNADGNGYGNFEYAVPSGYYALNTKNLAEFG